MRKVLAISHVAWQLTMRFICSLRTCDFSSLISLNFRVGLSTMILKWDSVLSRMHSVLLVKFHVPFLIWHVRCCKIPCITWQLSLYALYSISVELKFKHLIYLHKSSLENPIFVPRSNPPNKWPIIVTWGYSILIVICINIFVLFFWLMR